MNKKSKIISLIFKLIVIIASTFGVALSILMSSGSLVGGASVLMYFTIQSNIWINIVMIAGFILLCMELYKNQSIIPNWFRVTKLVFTVSITITGFVFCVMLAPFLPSAWVPANILTHAVVPLFSILDFFLFDWEGDYTFQNSLYATLPPNFYFLFTVIAYINDWKYSSGKNYPYNFMNYGGSAGLFGFSTDLSDSLFLGSFYWILFMIAFVIGLSFLYYKLINKRKQKMIRAYKRVV